MKMVAFAFVVTFLFSLNVNAELYHGIDIDEVLAQSDWSSKDKIKEIDEKAFIIVSHVEEVSGNGFTYSKEMREASF